MVELLIFVSQYTIKLIVFKIKTQPKIFYATVPATLSYNTYLIACLIYNNQAGKIQDKWSRKFTNYQTC